MTVIVYRDGVMAADTQAEDSLQRVAGLRKVMRGPDGTLYGAAGALALCSAFLRWVDGGCSGERPLMEVGDQRASVLVVAPDGGVSIWFQESSEDFGSIEYMAIGSGSAVAFGAMFAGCNAEDAVRAAIEHGLGCGGSVMAVRR